MPAFRSLALLPVVLAAACATVAADQLIVVGTQLKTPGHGFSIVRFDAETGTLRAPEFVLESPAPVFSVLHPDGRHLYVCQGVHELAGRRTGVLGAYAIDSATGRPTLLNLQPTGGGETTHVSLDRTGRFLFTASYDGGNVAAFRLEADGRIAERTAFVQHKGHGPRADRQESAHPHSIFADPTNRFVLVPDLGLDKVLVYRFDTQTGGLTPHTPAAFDLPPAAGPRHLAWHPDGRHVYVVNELANSVTSLDWDAAAGTLSAIQTLPTLGADFRGTNTAAEIAVHPTGRFLYVSNRGDENCLTVFAIEADTGKLTFVERVSSRGKRPRNFALTADGRWLFVTNYESDNASLFRVDPATGRLSPVGDPVHLPVPYGIAILPAAR